MSVMYILPDMNVAMNINIAPDFFLFFTREGKITVVASAVTVKS